MRKIALFLLTLGFTLSIFACVKYQAKPLSPSKNLAVFEGRTLADPELKKFLETNLHHELATWPLKEWDFPTLTLVSFYYHPDLDVARAKWGVASAGIKTAGGRPNPTIGFVPEYATNSDIGTSPFLFGFSFDIPIETAGKRGYRISQAKDLSEAARYNIATVAWQVRSRLRTSLLNLYIAKRGEVLFKNELSLKKNNLELLKKRISEKALSPFTLNEAELAINQTQISLGEEQKKSAEALVQVASALGVPVSAVQDIHFNFSFFEHLPGSLPSAEVRRMALLNRPDILESLANYAASESALKLEIAKQYPDIHISPGYNFDQGENKWVLGISITPPLFNRNQGPIAEAKARRTEAAANFNALQAKVIGEIDQSLAGYQAALKKLKSVNSLLSTLKNKQSYLEDYTNEGELRRVALLQGQMELFSSSSIFINNLLEAQQSLGLLEDAVQRPLDRREWELQITETNPRSQDTDTQKN